MVENPLTQFNAITALHQLYLKLCTLLSFSSAMNLFRSEDDYVKTQLIKQGGVSIMLWAHFSSIGPRNLIKMHGNLNSETQGNAKN